MKTILSLLILILVASTTANSQACNPQGDQTTYGTNNVWRGYVYDNANLTSYKGYVTEGTSGSPNFDESFGGSNTNYTTNGCHVQTETFSVRYKLTKTFNNYPYTITVGGDDGYRLSLDGGATWVINNWNDHSYTTTAYSATLNGTYNMVLEYYENGGDNRISISITSPCGSENTSIYGTANIWNAYLYRGTSFNTYVGLVHEGTTADASFNEDFGGSNTSFGTSGCAVQTEGFSARLRLTKTFTNGNYTFFVGGDDGYRLSIDGGATFIIDKWFDQSYNVTTATVHLNGTYNLVIEYYENAGDNRLSFTYQSGSILAVKLVSFGGEVNNNHADLNWTITADSDPDYFTLEKSLDGVHFTVAGTVKGTAGQNNAGIISYTFTDPSTSVGKSYYRLKMTDMSSVVTYSDLVSINTSGTQENDIKIFPTVVSGSTINIQSSRSLKDATIYVVDLSGKILSAQHIGRISGGQTTSFKNSITTAGIYLVRVTDESTPVSTQKIVIQ